MSELPIVIPKYQTKPTFSSAMAIIYAWNADIADSWVANNCLSTNFLHHDQDPFLPTRANPQLRNLCGNALLDCCLIDYYRYPYASIDNLRSFIMQSLHDGFYVVTSANLFYLPCYNIFNNMGNYCHPILIYGMDGDNLKIADHSLLCNGMYSLAQEKISHFLKGYASAHEECLNLNYLRGIYTLKILEGSENYPFSNKAVKSNLSKYLKSEVTTGKRWPQEHLDFDLPHGYNALLALLDYYKMKNFNDQLFHDVQLLHELYIHTLIILLVAKKLKTVSQIEKAQTNSDKCLALRNKLMKLNLVGDYTEYGAETLESIIKMDYEICSELYDEVKWV